jgi:hypothetical protein
MPCSCKRPVIIADNAPIRYVIARLERDAIGLNRMTLLSLCLSMIFSENRAHFSGSCSMGYIDRDY